MRQAVPLAVVVVALAGCGTSDDEAQVRRAAESFYGAIRDHDGDAACALLGSDTVKELESQESKQCAEAITGLDYRGGEVAAVAVYATNAKVDLSSGESLFLSRQREGWRLSALACESKQGKPRDRPFDCEVEA